MIFYQTYHIYLNTSIYYTFLNSILQTQFYLKFPYYFKTMFEEP